MINSWILNSMSKELALSVIYSDSAHEIWTDLKECLSQQNTPRLFEIGRDYIFEIRPVICC
ncbi:hypothetical protein Pint_20411 [Pistacia integerrima]|uniref:Uncharacterized protein n=1 Tax=Pistacia integerrima TaxID=434235 RepID=A0ACC0XD37_9ROSI|nr:hypothetical protein Pint_20411 [Pistacia integerrima]